MRELADLVISQKEEYKGLIFDADSFENAAYYRNSYNIPKEERLLVYALGQRCQNSLEGSGTFITNEAIYIHPAKKSWSDESRIPLSDICNFLVYENKNSEVKLFAEQKEYQIFATTRRGLNSTAGALVKLLHSLQNSLMLEIDNKKSYERTVMRILALIRKTQKENGILDDEYLSIVKVMQGFPFIAREAIFLELENEYRRCDKNSYEILLNSKKSDLNPENFEVLKNPDDIFFDAFIRDLSDLNAYADVKSIIEAYLNIKRLPKLSLCESEILSHLCVRMEDFSYFEKLMELTGDDMKEESLWKLFAYRARYKNHKISKVISRIAGGNEVTPTEYLSTNDIGLCSLHYMLILRNKDMIRSILHACDWSKIQSPFPKERMVDAMYNPMFLASIAIDDENLLRDIFLATSPSAAALKRSLKGVDSMIDINNALFEKYPENRREYEEKISEYTSLKKEMSRELMDLLHDEVERQKQMAGIIHEANHPFCEYLFELFKSQDSFMRWLSSTIYDYRISRYKNLFFVTMVGDQSSLSFYEWVNGVISDTNVSDSERGYSGSFSDKNSWDRRSFKIYDNPSFLEEMEKRRKLEEEKERRRQQFRERMEINSPYPGSWFSEAAHRSVKSLKEEYRILAKKYHPDSTRDAKSARIFMCIMTERAKIIESMKSQYNP